MNSYLHVIYTPSFENGSFLKIHLDYQTLKVTSPELSVWLGGWLQTAEQCSRLDINAGLGCAGRIEEPALCSLLQPIIFTYASFHNKREFNFNAISVKNKTKQKKKNRETHNTVFLNGVRNWHLLLSIYICTCLCMWCRQLTGTKRMTSTQMQGAA